MRRRPSLLVVVLSASFVTACDRNPSTAELRSCEAIAQATPLFSLLGLGANVTIAVATEDGCPAPIVRNETPDILKLDSVGVATFTITGKGIGDGRIRIRSAVDTLVTQLLSITVVAP